MTASVFYIGVFPGCDRISDSITCLDIFCMIHLSKEENISKWLSASSLGQFSNVFGSEIGIAAYHLKWMKT